MQSIEHDRDRGHFAVGLRSDGDVERRPAKKVSGHFRTADDEKDRRVTPQLLEDPSHRLTVHRQMNRRALELAQRGPPIVDSTDPKAAPPTCGDRVEATGELGIRRLKKEFVGAKGSCDQRDVRREARITPRSVADPENGDGGRTSTLRLSLGA